MAPKQRGLASARRAGGCSLGPAAVCPSPTAAVCPPPTGPVYPSPTAAVCPSPTGPVCPDSPPLLSRRHRPGLAEGPNLLPSLAAPRSPASGIPPPCRPHPGLRRPLTILPPPAGSGCRRRRRLPPRPPRCLPGGRRHGQARPPLRSPAAASAATAGGRRQRRGAAAEGAARKGADSRHPSPAGPGRCGGGNAPVSGVGGVAGIRSDAEEHLCDTASPPHLRVTAGSRSSSPAAGARGVARWDMVWWHPAGHGRVQVGAPGPGLARAHWASGWEGDKRGGCLLPRVP